MIKISFQFFGGRGSSGKAAGGGGGASAVVYNTFNTEDEADTVFKSSYGDWRKQINSSEKTEIEEYTGSAYVSINGVLRETSNPPSHVKDAYLARADNISSALSKFELNDNIVVFRGVNLDAFGLSGGDDMFSTATEKGMKALIGTTFVDKGFMSTSAVKSAAFNSKDARISINVPKGKGRGAWVKPLSTYSYENEFLLQKGSGLKITKVEKVGGHWEIQADLVGNDA